LGKIKNVPDHQPEILEATHRLTGLQMLKPKPKYAVTRMLTNINGHFRYLKIGAAYHV